MIKEFIFEKDKYFLSCHASTLAPLKNGNVIASWFGGGYEGCDDVAIWLSRRIDSHWEKPRKIMKINTDPHWNPVLFAPDNDTIYLYFKTGKYIQHWITWVTFSKDQGKTWSKAVELVPNDISGGRGPVKNKPIVLSNGDWLAPASIENEDRWQSFADISENKGKTWTRSNLIHFADENSAGKGVIQPTLWESTPGHVHMLLRSTSGKITRSDSNDYGRSWSQAEAIELPSNNSGIDIVKLSNCKLALIYNPTSDHNRRTPLRVSISSDNGESWNKNFDIEDANVNVGDIKKLTGGEFSYPSIIQSEDKIAAVYTWHRKLISFWELKIDDKRIS
jgi:predicted neuraminidase